MSRQQRRALERQRTNESLQSSPPVASKPSAPVSTGPRTPQGKAISSQNATSHGLTSSQLVLPWESQSEYNHLVTGLFAEHQPATITEEIMVKEMAEQYWRLLRARNHEYRLLERTEEVIANSRHDCSVLAQWEKSVTLAQRYVTRFERGFHKCLATLRTLQKERQTREAEAELEETPTESATETAGQFVLQNTTASMQPQQQFVSQNDRMQEQARSEAA